MHNFLRLAVLPVVMASAVGATSSHPAQPRTEATVLATSEAWSLAEIQGDADYLEWMLSPGYVSVNKDGTAFTKSALIGSARKRSGRVDAAAAKVQFEAFKAGHPYHAQVVFFGNTAIASYIITPADGKPLVESSDIFEYRGGNWHAIYSQHSEAKSAG